MAANASPPCCWCPDDLVHDHHVAKMHSARWHEAAHDCEGLVLLHGLQHGIVVSVAEDDLAPHVWMRILELWKDLIEAGYPELIKELGVIVYVNCAPGIKLQFHGGRR